MNKVEILIKINGAYFCLVIRKAALWSTLMVDHNFKRQAEEYRAKAVIARSVTVRNWADYCADVLDEQVIMLEKNGRCPEVRLPIRPSPIA